MADRQTAKLGEIAKSKLRQARWSPPEVDLNPIHGKRITSRVEFETVAITERKGDVPPVLSRAEVSARLPRLNARELGNLVAFLASDAASYITGQAIMVDGAAGNAL